jgi:hypothetical protein
MNALLSKVCPAWLRATFGILVLVCLSSAPVWGQAWNGSVSNNWLTNANWNGGTAPTSSSDASILNATNNPVVLTGTGNVGSLTLGATNSLNVGLGSWLGLYGPSISNAGSISLVAGSGNNTYLALEGNTTLSGGGTVTLNSGDNNGQVYIYQGTGGLTLTNADNTIRGVGTIGNSGLTLVNQAAGTINANSSAGTLYLNGSVGMTNAGLLEATGGGTLQISQSIANGGGVIKADGGTVKFVAGLTIQGGTLTSLNGGTLANSSAVNLDGSARARSPFLPAPRGPASSARSPTCKAPSSITAPSC